MAMTFTYDLAPGATGHGTTKKIVCSWTGSAGGAAAGTTAKISGYLIKGETDPTDTPLDNYDIVITDEEGLNVLGSSFDDLVDRDDTNTETVYFNLTDGVAPIAAYPVVCDALTVTIAAAGVSKSGVLTLYWR